MYIHQLPEWPSFIWNDQQLISKLGIVRHWQGKLIGKMEAIGFDLQSEAALETIILEVLNSNEIEGESLDKDQVRSSVARRLGLEIGGLPHSDQQTEGVVEMVLDAVQNYQDPLTSERLYAWHSALFPTGRSGMLEIKVGNWREDSTGPMQVVSGSAGKERVHFEAPSSDNIPKEMTSFLRWLNHDKSIDSVLKAGIAHFWFITIHPFDDGNGRIARALTDMLLARSDGISQRFYSMSTQIRKERNSYYEILETSQKSTLDITNWLLWFLDCLLKALNSADQILEKVIAKHTFWMKFSDISFNERQRKVLNKLLDGFYGKLTTSKWAKITKASQDTASRDINQLIELGVLIKGEGGGRNTHYLLTRDL